MNLKTRIRRLEAKVQKIVDRSKIIRITRMYGSSPSEEEMKIAINKLKELNRSSSEGKIIFIPYKFIDDFKCYFPKSAKTVEWDHDLGVDRSKGIVYKSVEEYDEKWARTGSDIQIVFCSSLVEKYDGKGAFTESDIRILFRVA